MWRNEWVRGRVWVDQLALLRVFRRIGNHHTFGVALQAGESLLVCTPSVLALGGGFAYYGGYPVSAARTAGPRSAIARVQLG